jgi:hypothetical protein
MKIKSKKITKRKVKNPESVSGFRKFSNFTISLIDNETARMKDQLKNDLGGYYSHNRITVKLLNNFKKEIEDDDFYLSELPSIVSELSYIFSKLNDERSEMDEYHLFRD